VKIVRLRSSDLTGYCLRNNDYSAGGWAGGRGVGGGGVEASTL